MTAAAATRTVLAALSLALLAAVSHAGSAGGAPPWKRDSIPPTKPANLHVTSAAPWSVSVAWDLSQDNVGVAGYLIYTGTEIYQRAGRSIVSNPAYTITGLECGQIATVMVAAFDRAGNRSDRALATVSTAACPDTEPPSTPSGFSQSATAPNAVVLRWNASRDNVGVVGYGVYRNLVRVASPTDPVATLSGLACGNGYSYTVDAVDAAGNHSVLANAYVQTASCGDGQPPSPPANLAATDNSQSSISLTWSPSTDNVDVAGYHVRVDGLLVSTLPQTSLIVSNLVCETSYAIGVDAFDAAGNQSSPSTITAATDDCTAPPPPPPPPGDTTPPSSPTGLAASGVSQTGLTLSWNASTDNVGVTGYDVLRNGAKVAYVTTTSSSQTGLMCGTAYTFGVVAHDGAGNSSSPAQLTASAAACSTPPPPPGDTTPPSSPTGLAASGVSQTGLTLNWNASTDNVGVTGYDVYRNGAKMGTGTSTSYGQAGLACATAYTFGVIARDAAGNSSAQAQLTASTTACSPPPPPPGDTTPPSTPGNLAVSSSTGTSVALSWSASTDNVAVTSYGVYRNGSSASSVNQPGANVTGLTCGTAYTFEVDAADAAGNRSSRVSVVGSTAACPDTQAPSAPANVVATTRTATSIALSWSASSDNVGVAGYGLYRGGNAAGTSSTTTGIFSGLTCNTNYTLAVDAYDAASNRSQKTTVMVATTACPDTTPPSSPTGLAALSVTAIGLTLAWNASSDNVGVTAYDVYRNGTKMATVSTTTLLQSGLACGTSYAFGVVARDAAGNSSQQAQLNASTSVCAPPPPPPPPPPSGAALRVSPSGSDSTCLRGDLSKACATFNKAYSLAQCSDRVQVDAGSYPDQTLLERSALSSCASVTIEAAAGTKPSVNRICLGSCTTGALSAVAPDNLVLRGFAVRGMLMPGDSQNIVVDRFDGGSFFIEGPVDVTIQNSDWGPCPSPSMAGSDQCLGGAGPQQSRLYSNVGGDPTYITRGIKIVNNVIHDHPRTGSDHWECLFVAGGMDVTIAGNWFYNCHTNGIAFGDENSDANTSGTWLIENNWGGDSGLCDFKFGGLPYSANMIFRFNSFAPGETICDEGPALDTSGSNGTIQIVGNVLGTSDSNFCVGGALYDSNYFIAGSQTSACGTNKRVGPQPYVNSNAYASADYHLAGASSAENSVLAAVPSSSLAVDRDGQGRAAPRDAGADER